jgi:gamma-glutamylcyclotransferase (GGCT)/AIG2-like uncharacterized protein YtfP
MEGAGMKKGDLLFVYGTLRKGERADLSRSSHSMCVDFVGEDRINGEMYNLGWYPGLKTTTREFVKPDEPIVEGDVFRIRSSSVVPFLDAYEGYPNLYNRIETRTASGKVVWVYTYNHAVSESQLVRAGNWRQRIEQGAAA